MSVYRMRLPDVGEGVAEAELVQWFVAVGDEVTTESVLAEVLTDKATVEVSSPVAGVVTTLHGEPGDVLAVGSDLVEIETSSAGPADKAPTEPAPVVESSADDEEPAVALEAEATPAPETDERGAAREPEEPKPDAPTAASRPAAAPAVRARARSLGLNLADVPGSGPGGRVVHADLDRLITESTSVRKRAAPQAVDGDAAGHEEPIRGVRRRIAERLTATWTEIPHITYVDAVDVSELERLREELNRENSDRGVRLTLLPFIARAIAIACAEQPRLNAHYDHATETLTTYDAVHLGVATQTDDGLLVPVIRHVEARELWGLAAELTRVTTAAREGAATREELSGSTITITSLGALGGLVTTPILNAPETAIVGVNKMETRPAWRNGTFEPRQMFNLSSSFDHRIVDGWDAATFVQRVKTLLETPALLFIGDE
jgi:2-oxoisovalerate dehydrogenase E2 component (dihydrolipoyl transacylase)